MMLRELVVIFLMAVQMLNCVLGYVLKLSIVGQKVQGSRDIATAEWRARRRSCYVPSQIVIRLLWVQLLLV